MAGGRPTKFTPERRAAIIDDIAHGVPYILAAEANGITEECLYQWMRHGKADYEADIKSDFAEFFQAIKEVERNKLRLHLGKVSENVERWQADAWLLERKWWKHFSSQVPVLDFEERLKAIEANKNKDAKDGI
jgi:transposase-like protein